MGKKSPGVREMIEPVNTQDFTSQPERRKPDQFEHVKFRIDGGVARMTLNRPDHNLLNEAMLREIAGGITHAGESDDVKLIVLDSAAKCFAAESTSANTLRNECFRCSTLFTRPSRVCWKSASPSSAS